MMQYKEFKTQEEAEAYAQGVKDAGAGWVTVEKLEIYPVIWRVTWIND